AASRLWAVAAVGTRARRQSASAARRVLDKMRARGRINPDLRNKVWNTWGPTGAYRTISSKKCLGDRERRSAGPRIRGPGAMPPANPGPPGRPYCTTVTARRFCDQHEISLQMATGLSLPKDLD